MEAFKNIRLGLWPQDIDFFETLAHVAKLEIIKTIMAFVAQRSWQIYRLLVKSALLIVVLKEPR
jgi:hypothetical protein